MSRPTIKWGQLKRFLEANGFEIRGSGGDKIIVAPVTHPLPAEGRNQISLGHTSCSRSGDEVKHCYINSICRNFGVTRQQIMDA